MRRRNGHALTILAIVLPVLVGITGLVLDTAVLMADRRNLQHVADAAATAAAMTIYQGGTVAEAAAQAKTCVQADNNLPSATVTLNSPPTSGLYAGNSSFVEVVVKRAAQTYFIQALGSASMTQLEACAVAGSAAATAGAAIVALDPNPPGITVDLAPVAPLSLSLPPLLGGIQVLGLGQLRVNGAVLDNNQWGGVDEGGNAAGAGPSPPYALSCTPLIGLTNLAAQDIRVAGGVDNPRYYSSTVAGKSSPLRANALPVPDPYSSLPAPTTAIDGKNVVATNRGGVQVISLPLLLPPTVLNPGVYDWISIVSGSVVFNPGVYVIRSVNPITHVALNVVAGNVTANGVMFYITDTASYSAATGSPDNGDGNAVAPAQGLGTLIPSVVIASLLGSSYAPLNDASSPFNGLDRKSVV